MKGKKAYKHFKKAYNKLMNSPDSGHHKKKKYRRAIDDDSTVPDIDNMPDPDSLDYQENDITPKNIPSPLINNTLSNAGVCFSPQLTGNHAHFVGMRYGEEGNICVVGPPGSGKSCIAKWTIVTYSGPIFALDIKRELSDFYNISHQKGIVTRPFIVLDPLRPDSKRFDPFYLLKQDDRENITTHVQEIALTLVPILPGDKDPFWIESEQSVLEAALIYYIDLGLSFIDAITAIVSLTLTETIEKISASDNVLAKMFLGETANLKPELIAAIDRGLRNKLTIFSTDQYIRNAFSGTSDNTDCFKWEDLNDFNIFLCIPADKIDLWGRPITLIFSQLIRHLERRPDKNNQEGKCSKQTLVLMDEFARFGKLPSITNALATLRSKNVNICLMLQSLAQLDKLYGQYDRRIILDNCSYKAVLGANDADTQQYFSQLIGTQICIRRGYSRSFGAFEEYAGHNEQTNECRENIVQPHELSTLSDILLLTPYGFCRVDKVQPHDIKLDQIFPVRQTFPADNISRTNCSPFISARAEEVIPYEKPDDLSDLPQNNGVKVICVYPYKRSQQE